MGHKIVKHLPEREERAIPFLNVVQRPDEQLQQLGAMHRCLSPGQGLQRRPALGQPGIHLVRKTDIPVRPPPPSPVVIRAAQEQSGIHRDNRFCRLADQIPEGARIPSGGTQFLQHGPKILVKGIGKQLCRELYRKQGGHTSKAPLGPRMFRKARRVSGVQGGDQLLQQFCIRILRCRNRLFQRLFGTDQAVQNTNGIRFTGGELYQLLPFRLVLCAGDRQVNEHSQRVDGGTDGQQSQQVIIPPVVGQ